MDQNMDLEILQMIFFLRINHQNLKLKLNAIQSRPYYRIHQTILSNLLKVSRILQVNQKYSWYILILRDSAQK